MKLAILAGTWVPGPETYFRREAVRLARRRTPGEASIQDVLALARLVWEQRFATAFDCD